MSGIKMRVPEIKVYVKLWETLGARPSRARLGRSLPRAQERRGRCGRRAGLGGLRREVPRSRQARDAHRSHHFVGPHHDKREGVSGSRARDAGSITGCAKDAVAWARDQAQKETEDVLAQDGRRGSHRAQDRHRRRSRRAKSEAAVAEMEKDGAWRGGLWGPDPEAVARRCSRIAASGLLDRIGRRRARPSAIGADPATWSPPSRCRFSRATSLSRPITWVEESATYAFIWMSFVGASLGLKYGRHILIATFGRASAAAQGRRACAHSSGRWCC